MATKKPTYTPPATFDAQLAEIDRMLASGYRLRPAQEPDAELEAPEERGMLRGIADTGLEVVSGAAKGIKFMTDVVGANNAASRGLDAVSTFAKDLQSAQAKGEDQRMGEIMRAAEDQGVWEQVKAALSAAGEAPIRQSLGAIGTGLPIMAASMLPGLREAAWGTRMGAVAGMGAAQGAGIVKSSIYDAVYERAKQEGRTEEEARAMAEQQQSYSENPGLIAGGSALGGAASATGLTPALMRTFARSGAGAGADAAAPGLMRSLGMGLLKETPLEAGQGGQEQYAGNMGQNRAGFETPWQRGVAGASTLEAALSAPGGLAGGAMDYAGAKNAPIPAPSPGDAIRSTELVPEGGPMTRAANVATEAKAQSADAMGASLTGTDPAALMGRSTDPLAGRIAADRQQTEDAAVARNQFADRNAGSLMGGGLGGSRADPLANMLGDARTSDANSFTNIQQVANNRPPMPASDAARILEEAKARDLDFTAAPHPDGGFVVVPRAWVTPAAAAKAETEIAQTLERMRQADAAPVQRAPRNGTTAQELDLTTDPVTNYVNDLRQVNTPAAKLFVRDFDAGSLTADDVRQRMEAERTKTPDERLAAAAAEGLRMNPKGNPFKTMMAAQRAAKQNPGEVVEVQGGYAIRQPQESASDPIETTAGPTDAGSSSEVPPAGAAAQGALNVQDAPQPAAGTQAQAAPGEAPAPAGRDAAATGGVPDAGVGAGVRADGLGKKQEFNIGGRDPHTVTFEHKDDGRLIRTITYPDGQVNTETLVTDRNGDESWASQSAYEKGEFYPAQLSGEEASTAIRDDISGKAVEPATAGAGVRADGVMRSMGRYGDAMTITQADAKVKELEKEARELRKKAAAAQTKFMENTARDGATRAATLARKLRDDIKDAVGAYPDARAEFEALKAGAGDVQADGVKEPPFAKKEDVEHLFGIDQKRKAALDRIAKGTAYFSTKEKAADFVAKSGIKDTHEVVQTGKVRFEVMPKVEGARQTKNDIITERRVTYEGKPATLEIIRKKDDPTNIDGARIKVDGERLPALNLGAQGPQTDDKFINGLIETEIINGNNQRADGQPAEPFEHAGLKIRPSRVKEGEQVVDRWVVQSPENAEREARGERQIGGDRIVETREQAIKTAEQEVKRYAKEKADRAEIDAQDKARRDADEAKKEANRGKTLLERRADAILDKPGKFPASAGLGLGTKREAMDKAIEQGRLVTEVMVDDTAAKKRDQDAVDAVRRAGYILGASNENIPVVKRGLEAQARLKEGKYQKPEYRVYQGSDRNGSFFEITKTEYDYVQKVKANPPAESKPKPEAGTAAWDGMNEDSKKQILLRAGWTTGKGELNFVGKNLMKRPWSDIGEGTRATIDKFGGPSAIGREAAAQPAATTVSPEPATPDVLGRNSQPIGEGGKPFKTKLDADKEKKLHPDRRVIKTDDGYVLAPKTPKQIAADAAKAKRLRNFNSGTPGKPTSAHEFVVSKGGMDAGARADLGVDGNPRVGNRTLFAGQGKPGLTLAKAAELLREAGYITDESESSASAIIKRSLTSPQYTPEGVEQLAEAEREAEFQDYVAAEQNSEPSDDWTTLTDDELADTGYGDYDESVQAEIRALVAQLEALNVDAESILGDVAQQTANATQQDYENAAKAALQAAIQRSAASSRQDSGQAGAEVGRTEAAADEGLTAPTQADIEAQQERAEQAEREKTAADKAAAEREAKDRERADVKRLSVAAADAFELGGDAMANLTGQADIFGIAEPEPAPASTPDEDPKLTQAEAAELMTWQDMGTTDGVKRHILTFYRSKADADAKTGRMTVATVTKGDRSATAWMVDGDDKTFGPLSLAKKRAMDVGIAKAVADGFVESGEVVEAPQEPAKKPAKPKSAAKEKADADLQARADYFTPGNIVGGYDGHDRVLAYTPPDKDSQWSVRVQAVVQRDGQWVDAPNERARSHSTPPDAKRLAKGPLQRAETLEPADTTPAKIDDSGEKIGGARKDRWKERGLNLDDLDGMTEAEGAEMATKANVWKPDYDAMAEAAEPVTAAMVKVIYDRLAAKPAKNTPEGRRQYVQMMRIVRDVYASAKGPDAVRNAYLEIRQRAGLNTMDPQAKASGRALLFSVYKGRTDPFTMDYTDLSKAKKMVEDGFPAKGEPWKTRLVVGRREGGAGTTARGIAMYTELSAEVGTPLTADQIEAGFFRVMDKKNKTVAFAASKEDAEAAAKTVYERDMKGSKDGKPEPERPHLDEMKRENLPKRIDRDATSEDFIKDLGFRGIEFGNWSAQDERQRILNMAYDGLMDLAEIMGVPPKAMSLNGTLGMAFGARGGGRFAAHYEPGKLVINMTKIRGGGSMAHEWAHAMDHYFGELNKADAYTTSARGASGWMVEDQYKGLPRSRMEQIDGKWKSVNKMRLDNLRPELAAAFDGVMQALFQKQINKAEMVRSQELGLERTEAMARMEPDAEMKAMYQRAAKNEREALEELRKDPEDKMYDSRGRSDFAQEAQALSGKSATGYWTRPTEMFARSFESWVFDRVTAMGARSDYLVHGVEADRFAGGGYKGNPYPTGAERARINAAFDKLSDTIQTKEDDAGNVAMFSRSPMKSVEANVRRGRQALAKALDEKTTVHRAMFRNGLGWVDFVWGAEGVVKASGNTKGAMGLAHIIEARQRKDGLTQAQATALMEDVVDAIASGSEFSRAELEGSTRVGVERGDTIVWLTKQKGSNAWIVTAYEKNPDGANAGRATSAPTSPAASLTRDQRVAGSSDIVRPAGSDVNMSRGAGSGLTQKAVQGVVDTISARWASAPEIVVVSDMQDAAIPERVRDADAEQRSQGASGEPEGFFYKGKVYIVAGALSKPADVVRVLFHETLGHFGLRGVFGESLTPILKQLAALRRADVMAKAEEYGLDMSKEADRLQAAEEVLAVLAQTRPELGYVQRAIAAIRAFLRKNVPGFAGMKMTDAEIINSFILPARRFVEGGGGPRGGLAAPAFSRQAQGKDADGAPMFSRTAGSMADQIRQFDVAGKTGNTLKHYLGMALQALGRRQLVDLYQDYLPQLKKYDRLVQNMEAEKNDTGAEADGLAREWAGLDEKAMVGVGPAKLPIGPAKYPGMERKLAELMHDATLAKIDPQKDYQSGDDKAQWTALRAKYNALSPKAQALYVQARDMYATHYAKVRKAIAERIERSEMSDSQKKQTMARMDDDFFKKTKGVYFPLARFGSYVMVVKDAAGEVVNVSRAETLNEAETTRKELQQVFPRDGGFNVSKVLKDAEFNPGRDAVGKGFMADLLNELDKQGVDDALRDSVSQLYLASLPDLSWAKHGIHRKGTPGFSQDARRAFAQNMFHGARHLAKLRYSDRLQGQLEAMDEHIKAYREIEEYDSVKAQQVLDEMVKRHESLMNPKTNPLSTALTSVGFVFYLGISPAAAMVNLSQTALVAYPIMGAKWGFGKASAALLRASKETVAAKNDISKVLQGDELAAYEKAVKDGTIDVTMAHDLAGISQGEDAKVTWALRPVMRAASFLFHHAERFNRQATFIASFRLAKEAGADNARAFEEAKKATYDGHFDYGAANRPRVMQGNVAKVVLLFKQYGQNMVYTLSRQAYLSMKGLTPADRAEARKQLSGILALHAAAAGALGLPLVGPLLAAASFLGGDDDEPWNAEVALKNALADELGPKAAEVLSHGLSRLTPWDISSRVALDRLILPDVREGLEGQDYAEAMMVQAVGPVGGIFVGMAKGLQSMSDGKYGRGFEEMLPVALRNPIKAIRFAEEGAVDKSGVVIKDEVSLSGVLGQASGFAPSEVRLATEGKSAIISYDRALMDRRQTLMAQFAQARMAGDTEGMADARKDIERFNSKNPARRITPANLIQSVRARQRRIDGAEQGVYLPKNRRDAMEAGRFAADAAL